MITAPTEKTGQQTGAAWYSGVTGYQWLVLAIASASWMFDTFEGQIYNLTRVNMLADILHVKIGDPLISNYGDQLLAFFLAGGTAGGLLFGSLSDKWGRRPTMAVTILMYSLFSGLTFFATHYWQIAILRFLVAMGVGGAWGAGASLVAEVFPPRARAQASGIFHATSVLGTWLATLAGLAVATQWRYGYVLGIVPALLILWVRQSIKEPESWQAASDKATEHAGPKMGSFRDLLLNPRWSKRAILGMLLAAVGLGSFWGVTIAGQDLTQQFLLKHGMSAAEAAQHAKKAYGFVETSGGFLGLLAFGPLSVRFGRRRTFQLMMLGAFLIVPVVCYLPQTYWQLLMILPVFGFLTLGIHAGFAIYFPELFPTHLRGTGTGFCFNVGRIIAASILFLSGWLKSRQGMDLRLAITLLGFLFPLGLVVIYFMPETKGQPLPD
jgi:MFS family permease